MRVAASHLLAALGATLVLVAVPTRAQAADTTAPVIKHTPVETVTRGENLIVMAHMKDESAIFGATLFYRPPNTANYTAQEMIRKGEDLWGAQVPISSDLEYYIEAFDEFGNGPSWAGAPSKPFLVKVIEPAPVYEADKKKKEEDSGDKVVVTKPDEGHAAEADDLSLPTTIRKSTQNDDDLSEQRPTPKSQIELGGIPHGVETEKPQEPIYRQWWFATGIGVVAAAAITTTVILLQPQPVERNVFGTGLRTP